jgi:hypothetical protein
LEPKRRGKSTEQKERAKSGENLRNKKYKKPEKNFSRSLTTSFPSLLFLSSHPSSLSFVFVFEMTNTVKLVVLRQTCLAEENSTVNGVVKNVHVVIKNQPFNIELALSGNLSSSEKLSFHNISIEANLLYDTPDNSKKEVGFIKVKPLEYSGHADEQDDKKFKLEVFIKILSSQHEDSLFKVHLRGVDLKTGKPIPGLEAVTRELLVISKPEVLRKKNEPRAKKRTRDDVLLEALSRIESRLDTQQQAIEKLRAERTVTPKPELPAQVQPAKPSLPTISDPESSTLQFMNSFHSLDSDERPEKVRKILRQFSARESETLFEIMDLFMAEGMNRPLVRGSQSNLVNPFAFDFQDHGYFGSSSPLDSPTSSLLDEEIGSGDYRDLPFFLEPDCAAPDVCLSL